MSTTKNKQALVMRGGWSGHRPVEATDSFLPFLNEHGYDVRVEDTSAVYADAGYMATVDVIVQSNTQNEIGHDELGGLIAAVENGSGLAGWHGGIADAYRASSDYLQFIGGQFATHPAKAPREELPGDGTDCFVRHTIDIVPEQAGHPIMAGIEDFALTTEQYWVLSDDYNDVLATTTIAAPDHHPWHRPVTCPAVWTRRWGAGPHLRGHPRSRPRRPRRPERPNHHREGHPVGRPLKIGVVGVGAISGAYLSTIERLDAVRLTAIADIDRARAGAIAEARGVRAMTVDELIADPEVELVLNLTVPAAHAEIALKAIAAGKHVYGEKPLAADLGEAKAIVDAGREAAVRVGSAPDTVLGTGIQTARKAIDDGLIGAPVAATATMATPGHEHWHPNPDFYYQPGGGPLLDMGPYYVTALVTLLGPIASVIGAASHARDTRTIGSGPRAGEVVPVAVDTHVTGVLRHESGALSTLVMSFDSVATRASDIEVHGATGSLIVPDPNRFDGDVLLHPLGGVWQTLPPSAGYRDSARGYGLADLAAAPPGTPFRANGDLGYHVLETMTAVLTSADRGTSIPVESTCERPAPVPLQDAPEAAG